MKLENVVSLDPVPGSHHHLETKNLVNANSLSNGRIPLSWVNHGENIFIVKAGAELCVGSTDFRPHQGVPFLWRASFTPGISAFLFQPSHIPGSGYLYLLS